jgi:hypothetical protein
MRSGGIDDNLRALRLGEALCPNSTRNLKTTREMCHLTYIL